jgi:hypothetical protein
MTPHKQPATTKQLATMNSEFVATVSNDANATNATKAPKKPTLSAKYSRFLSFGHWFLTQTDLNEETRKQLFQQMTMFGTVEEQTTYFEGFFGAIKETNKVMRKMVAEAKKPPKAPKAPRAKKAKTSPEADNVAAQLIADANGTDAVVEAVATGAAAAPKEKKPRAKKTKEPVAASADPVAEQIVAANATEAATEAATEGAAKEKKPRAKKVKETPAAASVAEPVVAADSVAEPVAASVAATETKEKKPRAKKSDAAEKPKKTKKTEAVAPVVEAPAAEEEGEDIQTRVVTIGDKEYLIDGENNLYDIQAPHDQVGTFNPENGQVLAL